ncbi:SOS response-associated peptidase [Brachybacterium saurashtrense]|uniref:Abasic site processing protein n=1 Tax=Brachybacterium saurashtrense TaxID=556288 RepID=A0A345YNJ8_9MICO|nr:SOS response-associated peptidase [Brachybacterium saurashtrense]AXK45500.1 SOS response-associated peptidase [Brachybacterium saurashtrense]RRR21128.1 SOS response-associated peptidase [Brachybacterium saurashtrense]
MCGRFAFFQEIEPLIDDLDAVDLEDPRLRARWNIPPTAPIHVITESIDRDTGEVLRALRAARWGLLPPFAKDQAFSSRTFNARRETLGEKPSFRGSLGRYRALVPMDGYYEWVRNDAGRRRQPYFIAPADGSPLYMAALVAWWKGPGGHEGPAASEDGAFLLSATIITREATGELAEIHDRTPVMLRREAVDAWLDTAMDDRHAAQEWILDDAHLLDDATLAVREVDPAVGTVGNDGPELLEPPRTLL